MKKKKCFKFFSSILDGKTQTNSQTPIPLQKKKEENRNNNNSESKLGWCPIVSFCYEKKKLVKILFLDENSSWWPNTSLTSKYVCKQLKDALKQN